MLLCIRNPLLAVGLGRLQPDWSWGKAPHTPHALPGVLQMLGGCEPHLAGVPQIQVLHVGGQRGGMHVLQVLLSPGLTVLWGGTARVRRVVAGPVAGLVGVVVVSGRHRPRMGVLLVGVPAVWGGAAG